jgi:hypothetical protein
MTWLCQRGKTSESTYMSLRKTNFHPAMEVMRALRPCLQVDKSS